jgi:transposase
VVLDHYATHTGKQVRAWYQKHRRFRFLHPPVPRSWMNQVEQWFGILKRKRLRIVDFPSKDHLAERLMAYVREWNERAHRFNGTEKSFEKVLAQCERSEETKDAA